MDVKTPAKVVKLDWSRLLGFDQASRDADLPAAERPSSKLGAKVGNKPAGNRPGAIKLGAKFGGKAAGTRPL